MLVLRMSSISECTIIIIWKQLSNCREPTLAALTDISIHFDKSLNDHFNVVPMRLQQLLVKLTIGKSHFDQLIHWRSGFSRRTERSIVRNGFWVPLRCDGRWPRGRLWRPCKCGGGPLVQRWCPVWWSWQVLETRKNFNVLIQIIKDLNEKCI